MTSVSLYGITNISNEGESKDNKPCVSTICTVNPRDLKGSTQGLGVGATNYSGIVSATEYYGSGANLTNVISGVEIQLSGSSVGTSATVLNFNAGFSTATPVSAGISTVETSRLLTIGVRSGAAVTFSLTGTSFNVSGRGGNVAIDV